VKLSSRNKFVWQMFCNRLQYYCTCQLTCLMRESHACGSITYVHTGHFLMPNSQFWTTCSITINVKNLIQSRISRQTSPVNGAKCCTFILNNRLTRSHQDFELRTAIFGNFQKSSEHLGQFSAVVRNFSETRLIWIRKSHAFDLGIVGRYILLCPKY